MDVEKHGMPPVGKKVSIHIQQRKDYSGSLAQSTRALVPDEEGWGDEAKTL